MGSSSKGGGTAKSYDYYGTIAGGFCWGPLDWITAIVYNGNFLWQGYLTLTADVTDMTGSLLDPTLIKRGGYLKVYRGTETQPSEPALLDSPNYLGWAYVAAKDLFFGQDSGTPGNLQLIGGRLPRVDTSIVAAADNIVDDGQVNPIAALAEILLDERGGNFPIALLDPVSWLASAHWCAQDPDHRAATFISPLITQQMSGRELVKRFLDPFNGFLTWINGKLACKIYEWGTIPGGTITLDARHWTKRPKIAHGDWTQVPTQIVTTYTDRSYEYQQNTVLLPNIRASLIRQRDDQLQIDRQDITRSDQAHRQTTEYLRRVATAPATFDLTVRGPFVANSLVGDKVLVDVDPEPGGAALAQLCRIQKIVQDATDNATLTLMTDDLAPAIPYKPVWAAVTPVSPTAPRLVNFLAVPLSPAAFGWPPAVGILATRPDWTLVGFEVFFGTSDSLPFADLGEQLGFACRGTLQASIGTTDTTIQITQPDGLDAPDSDLAANTPGGNTAEAQDDIELALIFTPDSFGRIALDSTGNPIMEWVSIVDRSLVSGATFNYTVLRGRKGSTAAAWTAGAPIWIIPGVNLEVWHHPELLQQLGSTALFRLVSTTGTVSDTSTPIPEAAVNLPALTSGFYSTPTISSGNLLYNSDFSAGTDSWGLANNTTGQTPVFGIDATHSLSAGFTALAYCSGSVAAGAAFDYQNAKAVPVSPGQSLEAYVFAANTSCQSQVLLSFYDKSGTLLSTASGNTVSGSYVDGSTIDQYHRSGVFATAPAGAAQARLSIHNTLPASGTPSVAFTRAYLGYAASGQDTWSPWSPAGMQIVTAGSVDATAPSDPGAPALVAAGINLSQSGATSAWIDFSVYPLPARAVEQVLLYRQHGATEWQISVPLTNTANTTARISGLEPGVGYDIAIRAATNFGIWGNIIAATAGGVGGVYTVTKSSLPNDPTGLSLTGPSSTNPIPPQYLGAGGPQLFAATLKWTPSTSLDVIAYEWGISSSSTTAPSTWVKTTANPPALNVYTATLLPQFVWLRSVDSSGNRSPGVCCATNLNSVVSLPAGTISNQNVDSVSVTGIQTGSGTSVPKVLVRCPKSIIYTTTGGAPTETITVDLTGAGFSVRPDACSISFTSPNPNVRAYYNQGSSTSTSAKIVLATIDGTAFGVSWAYGLSLEFLDLY